MTCSGDDKNTFDVTSMSAKLNFNIPRAAPNIFIPFCAPHP